SVAQPAIDIPEWLKSLGNENVIDKDLNLPEDHEVPSPEETIQPIEHEQPLDDLTEWLQTLGDEPKGDVPVETSLDQIHEPLKEIGDPDLASQPKEVIPVWLEDPAMELSIDESQRSSEEIGELTEDAVISEESASSKTGEVPEWVHALGSETSAEESTDSEAGLPEDIPELLAALDEEIKPEETFEPKLSKTGEPLMEHQEEIPELGPEDEDAALAWMESLAAKQGVNEEELLTNPDERQSTPTDWIQQISTQSEPIEQEDEETIVAITTGEIDESAGQIPDLELESSSSLSPETTSEPLEETEVVPDWLKVLMEETTPEEQTPMLDVQSTDHKQTVEESEPTDDLVPDWILELAEESVDIPTEHSLDKPAMIEGDTQPIMINEDEPEPSEVFSPELEVVQDIASSEQEIDLESTETTIEEQIEADSLYPFDEAETIPYTADDIPDWLKEEDVPESAQPAIEETKEQEFETPEWLAAEVVEESIQPTETSQIDQSEIADDELEIPEWIIASDVVEEVSDTHETIQSLEANLPGDDLEIPEGGLDAFSAETKISEPFKAVETELTEKRPETLAELVGSAGEEPSVTPTTEQPFTDEETKIPDWISADQEDSELETVESIQPLEVEKKDEESEITEWMEAEKVADWFEESEPVESIGVDITEEIKPVPERLEKNHIEDITDASVSTDFPEIPDESLAETLVVESPPSPININTASFMALDRLPGIGPVLAQTIIDYRETHGSFSSVDSLQDVPGIGAKNLEILRDLVDVEIKEEPVSLPEISEELILSDGRSALEKGDISKAYDRYSKLIEDEQMLEKVIEDMKAALHRYPIEVNIYELLGDAYLRTDQIQAAIDTYTKAEDLLR
ncbi:MAG: helix-hairpin-helix domain-containing protein, partial [Anaerolineales bacterium]|nr:helix-hairpin-helix domain-containing protein [Anaerolineales bacterium]